MRGNLIFIFIAIICFLVFRISAQEKFQVLFYNTENLFDCKHDSLKNDYEFLPNSIHGWHYGRYKQKVNNLAKVITAVGGWNSPALVGLCEVENEQVMDDLTRYSPLKEHQYKYVMTDSPDERGIDVALLWQRDRFKLLNHCSIQIHFGDKSRRATRDILHVTGLLSTFDTLDIFVCHMPSRMGGEKESEPARVEAATVLKQAVDSLYRVREIAHIFIMGDFNDYPDNTSIVKVLGAVAPGDSLASHCLYNLMADKGGDKIGTYKFQGQWGVLDQLIVSGNLLHCSEKFHTSNEDAHICALPFLLEEDDKYGGKKPFRTYYGMKYSGGYSDHLPIVVDFRE